jgi:hypothetical protein
LFRLVPRFVAYANDDHSYYGDELYTVVVRPLPNGKYHSVPTGQVAAPNQGIGPAVALVLASDGAVAWIAKDIYAPMPAYEVWRWDRRGTARLDHAADIDPASLRLRAHEVEWRRAGQVQHGDIATSRTMPLPNRSVARPRPDTLRAELTSSSGGLQNAIADSPV